MRSSKDEQRDNKKDDKSNREETVRGTANTNSKEDKSRGETKWERLRRGFI